MEQLKTADPPTIATDVEEALGGIACGVRDAQILVAQAAETAKLRDELNATLTERIQQLKRLEWFNDAASPLEFLNGPVLDYPTFCNRCDLLQMQIYKKSRTANLLDTIKSHQRNELRREAIIEKLPTWWACRLCLLGGILFGVIVGVFFGDWMQ